MLKLCLLTLTEEHFQFNETAHETVKVYGVLSVSITTDYGLQHRTVDMETCGTFVYRQFLLVCSVSFIAVDYF